MSTTLVLIALVALGWRMKRGLATKAEITLWLIWLVHLVIVASLTAAVREEHTIDTRYLKTVDCLVWGAAIWALLKVKYGKWIVSAVLALLVVYNAVMFTKHLVPGSRRNANLIACEWAQKVIADDCRDRDTAPDSKLFFLHEYTTGGKPVISPISKRMNYLLKARNACLEFGEKEGRPDYIVEEDKRLKFEPWQKSDYFLMDELQIKNRHYSIYKLRANGEQSK